MFNSYLVEEDMLYFMDGNNSMKNRERTRATERHAKRQEKYVKPDEQNKGDLCSEEGTSTFVL